MSKSSRHLLAFAFSYAVLIILPSYLTTRPQTASPTLGDLLDLMTPLVLLPLYVLACRDLLPRRSLLLIPWDWAAWLLLVGGLLFVEGHSLHLSANSISHLLQPLRITESSRLTYLYDEILSHHIWHAGTFGLALGAILLQLQFPLENPLNDLGVVRLAGGVFGATFGLSAIEGQTGPLSTAMAALVTGFLLLIRRRQITSNRHPFLVFYAVTFPTMLGVIGVWFLLNGLHLPEFSELGLLP